MLWTVRVENGDGILTLNFLEVISVLDKEKHSCSDVAHRAQNIDIKTPTQPVVVNVNFSFATRITHKDVFNELWSTNLPGEHTGADESKQHDDNIGDAHQQWWVVTMFVKSISHMMQKGQNVEQDLQ